MIYTLKHAVVSTCENYRYLLRRQWGISNDELPSSDERKTLHIVMLNPSTADSEKDDPTIRKCVGFADRLGYNGIAVLNVFALRATHPEDLVKKAADRVGDNYRFFASELSDADVLVGWGGWGRNKHLIASVDRARVEIRKAHPRKVFCLGMTETYMPRHPLMLPYTTEPQEFRL